MPGSSYPKPDDQKVNRVPPKFDWTNLPAAGRSGAAPGLPVWREWQQRTVDWWVDLWTTPQAAAWDQSGRTLWRLAELRDDAFVGGSIPAAISSEMRQIEDRHGLNPKAMLQLRWRVIDDGDEQGPTVERPMDDRRKRLKVV